MNGDPSQVDLFDPKPLLARYEGTVPGRDLTTGGWRKHPEFGKEVHG